MRLFDDPEIAHWTPLASPFDLLAAEEYLARVRRGRAAGERLHLAITTDGREPMGEVMLNVVAGTIGYGVGAAYRGQRLAYRALLLMTEYALQVERLPQVKLEIEAGNAASVAVARAAGYRLVNAEPVPVESNGRSYSLHTWVYGA